MARLRIPRLIPVALVLVAGLLFAGRAQAQCDVTNPMLTCPVAECIALQAQVHAPDSCGPPAPLACRNVTGCFNLRAMRQQWLNCYVARSRINVRCFGGGDMGHQIAAAQAIQNVYACDSIIALPEPEGCADPCPF
jgi:hypothetical protein